MFSRLNLLLCVCAFMFLAACAGSKGGSQSSFQGDDEYEAPVPKENELKQAYGEATSVTEDNHKMAKEIFDLKNRLGLPTDE